jgi:two-component system nitrate/nitrite response regulator NarL
VVRVLLVDDNASFRSLLRKLLERDPEIEVVGEAGDGEEAIAEADLHSPDVVLMDVSMPGISGFEATYALTARHPETAVLMLSIQDKDVDLAAALANGASEYLIKDMPAVEIAAAIKRHGRVV